MLHIAHAIKRVILIESAKIIRFKIVQMTILKIEYKSQFKLRSKFSNVDTFNISSPYETSITKSAKIFDRPLDFQLDTGASVSIMSEIQLNELGSPNLTEMKLQPTNFDDLKILTDKSDDETTNQIQALKSYMLDEKPFLNPALNMHVLSEKVKIPSRELSVMINQKLGQHFFDFINAYRIEEAMRI